MPRGRRRSAPSQVAPAAAAVDDAFTDDLLRRIRSNYGTVGICIYRVGSRRVQNGWGFGGALSVCRFHGDFSHIVRKNERETELDKDHALKRLAVRCVLFAGRSFPPTGFWTGWVRPLWFQRGHYVAGHYQPFFPKVSERRHRYVRFFGLGRGSRCYSQPGHGGKFLGNGRWQSENRTAGRHNLSDSFSDRIACFEPKDERLHFKVTG